MERIEKLEDAVDRLDTRMTIHETECTALRKEIRSFMGDVKILIRIGVLAALSGFASLLAWMFKEAVHVHVGFFDLTTDLTRLWITHS